MKHPNTIDVGDSNYFISWRAEHLLLPNWCRFV